MPKSCIINGFYAIELGRSDGLGIFMSSLGRPSLPRSLKANFENQSGYHLICKIFNKIYCIDYKERKYSELEKLLGIFLGRFCRSGGTNRPGHGPGNDGFPI